MPLRNAKISKVGDGIVLATHRKVERPNWYDINKQLTGKIGSIGIHRFTYFLVIKLLFRFLFLASAKPQLLWYLQVLRFVVLSLWDIKRPYARSTALFEQTIVWWAAFTSVSRCRQVATLTQFPFETEELQSWICLDLG